MNISTLELLARIVLPEEVFEYFDIIDIHQDDIEIHIHLDEKVSKELKTNSNFESKGFLPEVTITDFPIRDHKVLLKIRRRRWIDLSTGKSFSNTISLTAEGTRYSKEFASFLKETYGCFPDNLPYS